MMELTSPGARCVPNALNVNITALSIATKQPQLHNEYIIEEINMKSKFPGILIYQGILTLRNFKK